MAKHYQRTWHLKVDIERVKKIIEKNKEKFFCPFSNENSYLNIYKGTECDVKFLNLQHCDYSREPNAAGKKYIRYLMMLEHKAGRKEKQEFLKEHYDKFTVETNEENFCVPDEDKDIQHLLLYLNNSWEFDASKRPKGRVVRARVVELPAGGVMPYHRDETASENIRVICPIVTHKDVQNAFKDSDGEHIYNFPASGNFYTFEEDKIEHAVFNKSDVTRYALIFTVLGLNISELKEWDRAYKKNKMFWDAYSRGI